VGLIITPEELAAEAEATGFRADVLEKSAHQLGLLEAMRSDPFLKGKLVLKGGTALNLFVFDAPRLSVDIDLNYVGAQDRDGMLAERPEVEPTLQTLFAREGLTVKRVPKEHAGGKWRLFYESVHGGRGNLEVDLNFMCRVPLWPVTTIDSHPVGTWRATSIPVLDRHELAAGKLAALLGRQKARDLLDSHRILRMDNLDSQRLRVGFVVYGAMGRRDWRTVSADDVGFDAMELARGLVPILRVNAAEAQAESAKYIERLVRECREGLSAVLPFTDPERAFLDSLMDRAVIDPTLLTADESLQRRIQSQPLLEWKALNVRRRKGLS
jgi:predicted nucleotidyltransferase component of viral defense system